MVGVGGCDGGCDGETIMVLSYLVQLREKDEQLRMDEVTQQYEKMTEEFQKKKDE